jgi:hypothetical protein
MHRQAESQFAQMDMNREMQRAQNITNAAQQASNALLSAASALGQDGGAAKLKGGDNGGVPTSQVEPPPAKVYIQGNNLMKGGEYTVDEIEKYKNMIAG